MWHLKGVIFVYDILKMSTFAVKNFLTLLKLKHVRFIFPFFFFLAACWNSHHVVCRKVLIAFLLLLIGIIEFLAPWKWLKNWILSVVIAAACACQFLLVFFFGKCEAEAGWWSSLIGLMFVDEERLQCCEARLQPWWHCGLFLRRFYSFKIL